jgi:shikimate dehydrogenase
MRLFGLVGKSLTHSFSQTYFTQKFYHLGMEDCRYELFELASPSELPELLAQHPDLVGLNVTIPYKEQIWPYLTDVASSAALVGAVNVIERREDGSLIGHNTDYVGFRESLRNFYPVRGPEARALVLGTGGARPIGGSPNLRRADAGSAGGTLPHREYYPPGYVSEC